MAILHRYHSTLHGNYRMAYLRSGLLVGVLLAAYVLIRALLRTPMPNAISLVVDVVLIVVVFLSMAYYRNSLPNKAITLKEGMLFGIGMSAVCGVVYGLLLWLIQLAIPMQTVVFTNTLMPDGIDLGSPNLHYWAAWWALLSGLEVMLVGAFAAFVAAIVFRTEKAEVRTRKGSMHHASEHNNNGNNN